MNAQLTAYPDCSEDYAVTLAQAASEWSRGAGWGLSPEEVLVVAASVLPEGQDVPPEGASLSKVIDWYLTLRREGLGHAAAVEAIREAFDRATYGLP